MPRKKTTPTTITKTRTPVRKGVSVRFHTDQKQWAILGDDHNPIEFFDYGYMKNVRFSNLEISDNIFGCGSRYPYVGIATGDLVVNKYHKDQKDLVNLGFNGRHFVSMNSGAAFSETPLLHLLPERRALAKNPTA